MRLPVAEDHHVDVAIRRRTSVGKIPPAEAEERYYAILEKPAIATDVNLSAHPARIFRLRHKACRSCGIPPGSPVDPPCLPDDAAPSLPRPYSDLSATTNGSVPWRRIATSASPCGLVPFACHRHRRFPQFNVEHDPHHLISAA